MFTTRFLSLIAAITGSTCCVIPLAFAILGLGTLGVGTFVGTFKWYFLGAGVLLLGLAWFFYLHEKKVARATACPVQGEKTTLTCLGAASLIVLLFLSMNIAAHFRSDLRLQRSEVVAPSSVVIIPVKGMTCVTCEIVVEESLVTLPGIISALASERHENVVVTFKPGLVTFQQMEEAIKKTGFEPILMEAQEQVPASS